ncbi:hypothetical protein D3C81_2195140 [compost metagenome]
MIGPFPILGPSIYVQTVGASMIDLLRYCKLFVAFLGPALCGAVLKVRSKDNCRISLIRSIGRCPHRQHRSRQDDQRQP